MNDRVEIGRWSTVYSGDDLMGSFLDRGELGVETYGGDDVLIGDFADTDEAFTAIDEWWARKCRSNGDDSHATASEKPRSMLAAALDWAEAGWAIFPAPPGKKKSYKSAKYSGGARWGATHDPEQVRRDFQRWPDANIGVPTGKDNAVWVLESDTLKGHNVDGIASLRALEAQHGALPDTLMAESPSGSLHHYFDWPKGVEIRNSTSDIGPGIDVRGEGGMVIAPPSVRGDGCYRWLNDNDIAEAPQWLIDLVTTKSRSNGKSADGGALQPPRIKIAAAFANVPVRNLGEGIVLQEYHPLPFAPIKAECGWLRHVHDTGGSDQSEILWRDALRVCMFLEQGESLIHDFSSKHAEYDIEKTEAKFARARKDKETNDLGYPKCQTICDHGSAHCKTCRHLAAEGSPLHLALQRLPDDLETTNSLDVWDAGEDTEVPPPRGWLLGNSFCRRKVSSLIASSGVGKTALRILQGISLALGRSLTGEHVFIRTRVLIICLEDDKDELRRRVRAVLMHYGISQADLKGWLFLAAPGTRGGKLLTANSRTGMLTAGTLGPLIEAEVIEHGIGLVVMDPLVKAHGVNENSNDEMDAVAQLLTGLADKLDIAIDAPHHVSKGAADPGNPDRGRGASAMNAAARLVYSLTPMSSSEAEQFGTPEDERRDYVRLDRAKLNTARSSGPASWFQLVSVNIGNADATYPAGDEVQAAKVWNPPESWAGIEQGTINAILNTLERGLGDGNYYSAHNNAAADRAAWGVITHHAPHKNEGQARTIIKTWIKKGLLYKVSYNSPQTRKTVQGLRVNNNKRPAESLRQSAPILRQ